MWNKKHSLLLSKIATLGFTLGILAVLALAPRFARWIIAVADSAQPSIYTFLLITFYSGGPIALVLVWKLYQLLNNISKQQVFIWDNVKYLRVISWLCFIGGTLATISVFYWIFWLPVGVVAYFMCLIVRVVKNILAEAVTIKEEMDYTI